MRQELLALGKERSKAFVLSFLDRFLPARKSSADDYHFPEFQDPPHIVYDDDCDALDYLERNSSETYALYWNNLDVEGDIGQACAYFLEDGHVLMSICVWESLVDRYVPELRAFVASPYLCLGDESRPGDTLSEFLQRCGNDRAGDSAGTRSDR